MRQSLLLDFYGALLTEKQRSCYDLHINEDLSLSEIAEQSGISRQAVWDNIRRAEDALLEFEEKTGLIKRSESCREALRYLKRLAGTLVETTEGDARETAQALLRGLCRLEE